MKSTLTPEERQHLAWETALDRLELDVLVCDRMARRGEDPPHLREWDLPTDLGPIPEDLRERAQAIHARQAAALEALAGAVVDLRRRQEDVDRGGATYAGAVRAAYVDTHV
ncbi:hypothetical protein [Nocardioides perillae]|uniref:Flagellar protein FliT n=1 Tax=Nocardioides perillae TaxID=1119534 RepID=A0A7Y9RZL0_9ACTN|nr:hypothetical protein [Nocardioides perillae]NYG57024.1 hypothetical protein [Nocardioides perillae]